MKVWQDEIGRFHWGCHCGVGNWHLSQLARDQMAVDHQTWCGDRDDGPFEPECWGLNSYEHYKGVCKHFTGEAQ